MNLRSTFVLTTLVALTPAISHATIFTFDLLGKDGSGLIAGNENHVPVTPGTGGESGAGITFDDVTKILSIDIAWGSINGFTDLTGVASAAHVHGPTVSSGVGSFTENASVLFGITGSGFTFNNNASSGFITGASAPLNPTNEAALFAGSLYINVHTTTNPGGEIRGNLVNPTAIPEPSAFAALAGAGVLGLAALRRRRTQA